jgi:hypothetical protein
MRAHLSRRDLLFTTLALAASALTPLRVALAEAEQAGYCWDSFILRMRDLADEYDSGQLASDDIARQGIEYMKALDIDSRSFADALTGAFESGNEYWMWQRMLKKKNVLGGVLNIDSSRLVQLHDHPGSTGMLRILSGEAEVWQYDRVNSSNDGTTADLKLTARRILNPGDTAYLTPEKGNVHALKSITAECRMLDFFIPPYQQNLRTWFEPMEKNWQALKQFKCRCISQYELVSAE